MSTTLTSRYAVVALGVVLLSGCGAAGRSQQGAASAAALSFERSVADDPGKACRLLAPKTRQDLESDGPCPQSLREQDLPQAHAVRRTQVFGTDAMAELDGDTLFLALFPDGWRVTAAGCKPQATDRPYDCTVKGT
ncbi:hypothetical protein [Pedococcus sp. 5OH_020]|uniref:hypothetical protein n=1 Tax=Pedococcus sp. 5OH_020 TaxID=2989814 RepID=UPI0022E9D5BC|nr:hypothetical protein [Pedococcus sp. 5OH_020]